MKSGMFRERMILLISAVSWMKEIMRMVPLHLGHSSGLISSTRFIQAAQVEEDLVIGSGFISSRVTGCSFFVTIQHSSRKRHIWRILNEKLA